MLKCIIYNFYVKLNKHSYCQNSDLFQVIHMNIETVNA